MVLGKENIYSAKGWTFCTLSSRRLSQRVRSLISRSNSPNHPCHYEDGTEVTDEAIHGGSGARSTGLALVQWIATGYALAIKTLLWMKEDYIY